MRLLTSQTNRPLHVIGNGDLGLECSWDEDVGGTVVCGLEEGRATIRGEAVELAPE